VRKEPTTKGFKLLALPFPFYNKLSHDSRWYLSAANRLARFVL